MTQIVECVPNISEGRDRQKIDAVVAAVSGVSGVRVLDVDPGADTNRTVITFAGAPQAVLEGAFQLIKKTAELLDMQKHTGAHPRMGACDVCPFVPVSGVTIDDCAELACKLGARVAEELKIPVYLYEHAATKPERQNLSTVRKGEYEGLKDKLQEPDWAPDFGTRQFNAKSGASIIGARPFLIAYNVNLNTRSKKLANEIAKEIRESGVPLRDALGKLVKDKDGNTVYKPGKFEHCKAVGWYIKTYGCAQVSINLTDFMVTGMHDVFDACAEVAARLGIRVTGSELVGLVPKQALLDAGRHYLIKQGVYSAVSEKELIHAAIKSLGLSEIAVFNPKERIIEEQLAEETPLADMTVRAFVDELASDSVAPGGGSVAALAGSLAAALSNMVCTLTYSKPKLKEAHKKVHELGLQAETLKAACLRALDEDTKAFLEVMNAFRGVPKDADEKSAAYRDAQERIQQAYKHATAIPLSVAQNAVQVLEIASQIAAIGLATALSDIAVAGVMAKGALVGGAYNVRINLVEIKDKTFTTNTAQTLRDIESQGERLVTQLLQTVDQRLGVAN